MQPNHNQAVAVKTRVKAGELPENHNQAVAVKTRIKAGAGAVRRVNHNQAVAVRTRVNAGDVTLSGS